MNMTKRELEISNRSLIRDVDRLYTENAELKKRIKELEPAVPKRTIGGRTFVRTNKIVKGVIDQQP